MCLWLSSWRRCPLCSAHPTSNAGASLGKNCSTAHPSERSPQGNVHPHLAGGVHSPFRASGVGKEGSCLTACDTAPTLVGRDLSFRSWSVYQGLQWVGPRETALASMSQQAPGHVPNRSQWSQHRPGTQFQNNAKRVKKFQQCRKIRPGQSPFRRLRLSRPLRNKLETLARRVEGLLIGRLRIHISSQADAWKVYAQRVRWTWLLGEGVKSFRLAWPCARHGAKYDVTEPRVLTGNR